MKLNERIHSGAIAAAVALACGSGFVSDISDAATFPTSGASTVTLSSQYVARAQATGANTNLLTITATVTSQVGYASGDRIRIAISNASFATSGISSPTVANGCTVDALTYDGTVANYRVPASGMATGARCDYPLVIRTSTVSGDVGLTYSSFIAGTTEALESPVSSGTLVTTLNQFSAAIARRFAGVVDVERDRYHFTADDPTTASSLLGGFESQLLVSINNSAPLMSTDRAAAVSSVTVTVVGDFSWLDDDGSNSCGAVDLTTGAGRAAASYSGGGGSGAFSLACPSSGDSTLTYVLTNGAGGLSLTSGVLTIAVGKTGSNTAALATNSLGTIEKRISAPATFSASVDFVYFEPARGASTTGTTPAVAGASAGSFTLNGSTVNIPFMPYGSGISRVLYLTNRSSQTGSITISLVADGTGAACNGTSSVTAKANGVTLLSDLLDNTVTACYGAAFAGKVAAVITSNTPSANTEVFSAYNRAGDLVTIVNSSNGK